MSKIDLAIDASRGLLGEPTEAEKKVMATLQKSSETATTAQYETEVDDPQVATLVSPVPGAPTMPGGLWPGREEEAARPGDTDHEVDRMTPGRASQLTAICRLQIEGLAAFRDEVRSDLRAMQAAIKGIQSHTLTHPRMTHVEAQVDALVVMVADLRKAGAIQSGTATALVPGFKQLQRVVNGLVVVAFIQAGMSFGAILCALLALALR